MADKQNLTAQQRAALFAMSTRQNIQMLPTETATSGATTLQFQLPKARLLSSILVNVEAKINIKHATKTSIESDMFTPYKLLRRISLDLNNSFVPFTISGKEACMYNMIDIHPDIVAPVSTSKLAYAYAPNFVASSAGTDNEFSFTVNLTNTTNPRDPVGLISLQHSTALVNLVCDIANGADMFKDTEGYTIDIKEVKVTPMVETFSFPANAEAVPDLSVLKICNGRVDSMPSVGQQIIKLTTGQIYRKIILYLEDENGAPLTPDKINSTIDIVFNQADINYAVNPKLLHIYNQKMLGYELPAGMYVFDFSNSGSFANLGGTRDFIDSANLSELWLRFNTTVKGKATIVTECLSRLV